MRQFKYLACSLLDRYVFPTTLFLFTTRVCNLNCTYCSTNSNRRTGGQLLTLGEQRRLLMESKSMGLDSVYFCGAGEPMLDRNLFPLIRYARRLSMKPFLITNGTMLTEESARFLHENRVSLFIKLESLNRLRADKICGKRNSFVWVKHKERGKEIKIPSGLKNALDQYRSRISRRMIMVDTVLNRINREDITGIARFCKAAGIGFNLREIRVAGQAERNLARINLTRSEVDDVYDQLIPIMGRRFVRRLRREHCIMRYNPCISEDGECIVCESVGASSGNIRNQPLRKLFKGSIRAKRTIPCNVQYYKRRTD
jgi:MoaA/NifB/PqqE/SkfB family radical SAM enzyme